VRGAAKDGRGPIRLSTIVDQIEWRRGRVTVRARTPDGRRTPAITARVVVVTLPIGVLQARPPARGAVRFVPQLPAATAAAIASLEMGSVIKVVLLMNRSPWAGRLPSGLGFLHVSGGAFPTFWTLVEGPRPMITAWAAGPAATRLHALADDQLRRRAVSTLAHALRLRPAELQGDVGGELCADWASDPFARGAYSYIPIGARDAATALARGIDSTLLFAGEASETGGHSATVHGAVMTGIRAAQQARAALASGTASGNRRP
jgi:monoamine oxidase